MIIVSSRGRSSNSSKNSSNRRSSYCSSAVAAVVEAITTNRNFSIRASCPSMFSSIAIELNVPSDDFCSVAIELTFVTLGHGFKKAGSVLFDIFAPRTRPTF